MKTKPPSLSHDYTARLQTHLRSQPPEKLIELLLDLIRAVDEPTRQRFWPRLAPPDLATADLRYPSAEVFLTKLAEFADAVSRGDYLDEEAQTYYGDDPADREYHFGHYELEDHQGMQRLKAFLAEADSYFQAGRFDTAAQAYEQLIAMTLKADAYETLGVDAPLSELAQDEEQLVKHYFQALLSSHPLAEALEHGLACLAWLDKPYTRHRENFLELVGTERTSELRAYLEQWAECLEAQTAPPVLSGLPIQLQLLLRLDQAESGAAAVVALCKRFRHRYPTLYTPLLADREAAHDWPAVIDFGQEALTYVSPSALSYWGGATFDQPWAAVNPLTVRTQLAQAYTATGNPARAFAVYRPVYDQAPDFATYAEARRLAEAVAPKRAQTFTADVIAALRSQPRQRYLLCQVYLSEGDFTAAYALVEKASEIYGDLEATKLVAKAHLLAALGPKAKPKMGRYLHELYANLKAEEEESIRFLRQTPLRPSGLSSETALARAEQLYQRLLQAHIDHGRQTYAVAAYYCALLGEIAAHEGRLAQFAEFYETLMRGYTRHRALRAEMEAKVGPLLSLALKPQIGQVAFSEFFGQNPIE